MDGKTSLVAWSKQGLPNSTVLPLSTSHRSIPAMVEARTADEHDFNSSESVQHSQLARSPYALKMARMYIRARGRENIDFRCICKQRQRKGEEGSENNDQYDPMNHGAN